MIALYLSYSYAPVCKLAYLKYAFEDRVFDRSEEGRGEEDGPPPAKQDRGGAIEMISNSYSVPGMGPEMWNRQPFLSWI